MLLDTFFSQGDATTKVIIFLTFTLAVILALTIHEFSHSFMAYKLGDKTPKLAGRLTLNPMAHFDAIGLLSFLFLGFGWAKPVPINPNNFKKIKRDSLLVSLAGIFANLILAFVAYPLFLLTLRLPATWWSLALQLLTLYIFNNNLVFAVFNLLPIYPLDGYNAVASQLSYSNKYVNFMRRYGALVLLFVIVLFNRTSVFNFLVNYVGYPIEAFWGLFL